ncbi:MAG: Fe3+-siderophores ABC transporter protein [Gammaproteobacteria bacterium]|nr:Fe3+-siderophores ABC transporter protein [Gammaproteobacteria bacterium]
MRVISLVPSLTETLLECGVEVVGRTRFCVHPVESVKDITKVGGTKGVDWTRCAALRPDLVIFDREENLKAMADECPFPWHATHITSVDSAGPELARLAESLNNAGLAQMAADWVALAARPARQMAPIAELPGVIDWLQPPPDSVQQLNYIIWRDPWMAVARHTFIGSVLERLGYAPLLAEFDSVYPELEEAQMQTEGCVNLFSSEPYPFARHTDALRAAGYHGALVDGECFSWFGIRSYRFLQAHL